MSVNNSATFHRRNNSMMARELLLIPIRFCGSHWEWLKHSEEKNGHKRVAKIIVGIVATPFITIAVLFAFILDVIAAIYISVSGRQWTSDYEI